MRNHPLGICEVVNNFAVIVGIAAIGDCGLNEPTRTHEPHNVVTNSRFCYSFPP